MRYTARPQRKKQLAAKLAANSVGIKKRRAKPIAKKVYIKAVVTAKSKHVDRDMSRVETANDMKSSNGNPRRADWAARNVCHMSACCRCSMCGKIDGEFGVASGKGAELLELQLTFPWRKPFVCRCLKLVAHTACSALDLVAYAVYRLFESRHGERGYGEES
jgi:hypothetical protein